MQALVLAGGEGTRLRPLTTTIPKPVLPIANKPFLSYMIDWLAVHGFDELVLSCGFLADGVRAVIGEGEGGPVRIRYVTEPEPLGTAGAVKYPEDVLDERFAVLNGDVLTDLDLSRLWALHEEREARATITLIEVEDPSAYGLVLTDDDGRVTDFLEKPEGPVPGGGAFINAGAYVLEREVLDRVPAGRAVSFEREVFPSLIGDGLYACRLQGYWLDIGTPERYLQATRDILAGAIKTARIERPIGEGSAIDDDAKLRSPLLVGAHCEIAQGAQVGPESVLGDGCTVGARARVEDAVLHCEAKIEEGAVVRDSIVGPGASIGAGSRIEDHTIVGSGADVPPGSSLAGARVGGPSQGLPVD
jgi:mannose-1-phosphate guanylyltransferase